MMGAQKTRTRILKRSNQRFGTKGVRQIESNQSIKTKPKRVKIAVK